MFNYVLNTAISEKSPTIFSVYWKVLKEVQNVRVRINYISGVKSYNRPKAVSNC